jgi:hypothetical protein
MKERMMNATGATTLRAILGTAVIALLAHFLAPARAQNNARALSAANLIVIVTPTPGITVPAIESKYAGLGGSSGFMGAPTSVTTRSADGVGYYRHYQGGSIFYTPATGAKVVRGAIREKYGALGWERGFLRYPTTDELSASGHTGYFSQFQGGAIYWSSATGAHEIHGAILDKWAALGSERSILGYPLTDETATPDGVGRYNHFQGGSIYWTPPTGAHEIHGYIREKWAKLGWEQSSLGYPTSDEASTPDGVGRYNLFEKGGIHWTPATGAHAVRGAIWDKWARLGWERSSLGYPITDELTKSVLHVPLSRFNKFQHGAISVGLTGDVAVTGEMWTELRIQAVLLSDDDGSNPVNMSGAEVTTWLNYANKVYAPAFIHFNFDPAADCATKNSTELNQKQPPQDKANAEAAKYPGKIVVFFRARANGNGYSWGPEEGVKYVLMPGFSTTLVCSHQNLAQLAHDLGHYLGLPHTFPGKSDFETLAAAKDWLTKMGNFDGDGFSDTPEDPGVFVATAQYKADAQCGPTPASVTFEGRAYILPRTNVMSYYSDTMVDFNKKALVQSLTPQQFDRVYDVLMIRKLL